MNTTIIDIPSEIFCLNISQELSSNDIKVFLRDKTFFQHIKSVYPWIIKDCFTSIEDVDENYNNVYDMKRWIFSNESSIFKKIVTILNYEWCFVDPLKAILNLIERYYNVSDIPYELIIRRILSNNNYTHRTPKTIISLIKTFIDNKKYYYDPSACDNYAIRKASENGYLQIIKMLLKDPRVDPSAYDNLCIQQASKNGHLQVVKLLLKHPKIDPSACGNSCIKKASKNGYHQIVELLLKHPKVDPSASDNLCIRLASKNGYHQIVELLLKHPKVDPSAFDNLCIRLASKNGYHQIVELLLSDSRVDPSGFNNLCIRLASKRGHLKVVELLLSDSRVDPSAYGNLCIILASKRGHIRIVELLLKHPKLNHLRM